MYEANERIGLYPIGKLSKMVGISVDTLRYYEEIGLFKPAYTDRDSGYRYYTSGQAAGLARILELKEFGFPLKEIKELLTADEPTLTEAYQRRYQKLKEESNKLSAITQRLLNKIKPKQEGLWMGKRILLVDDADFMRMMCKDLLTKAGYEICGEASDGAQGVEAYRDTLPDIVLMDIVMPAMDGILALQKIKEINAGAVVLMLSAMASARMVTESFMAGAKGFVVKPFQSQELERGIQEVLTANAAYSQGILKQIHGRCTDDTKILSQLEIDEIKRAALIGSSREQETDELIKRLNKKPFAPHIEVGTEIINSDVMDEFAKMVIEEQNGVIPMLDKIAQSQDDIKALLGELIKKDKA